MAPAVTQFLPGLGEKAPWLPESGLTSHLLEAGKDRGEGGSEEEGRKRVRNGREKEEGERENGEGKGQKEGKLE